MKVFKKILQCLAILLGVVLLAAVCLFTYLAITEYRPEAEEALPIVEHGEYHTDFDERALDKSTVSVLTWNIGYCGLGRESDFFMDGGSMVRPESEEWVVKNLAGVEGFLAGLRPDFILLQEVDTGSRRSYDRDQAVSINEALRQNYCYALNFSTKYVPYPWPPIGGVQSGLLSSSGYPISEATRISLPCPFSWPMSMVNLKRCLLVSRIPIADSDKELVLVNLHLEAYDDGEGKLAQSKQLREFVEQEYRKGNYVVAGGDWNQVFPESETAWPNTHRELWEPGYLDEKELAEGWRYVWDAAVPSCRLLNQPYDPADQENTQYYVIDGFLVSPNVTVESVETLDEGFEYSDHNPVLLTLTMEN